MNSYKDKFFDLLYLLLLYFFLLISLSDILQCIFEMAQNIILDFPSFIFSWYFVLLVVYI